MLFLLLHTKYSPYKSDNDNTIQFCSLLATVVTLLMGQIILTTDEDTSAASVGDNTTTEIGSTARRLLCVGNDEYGPWMIPAVLLGFNIVVFVVALQLLCRYTSDTVSVSQTEQPLIFEKDSKVALQLNPKTGDYVHLFLSHTQRTGQDLTTTVNLSLKLVLPNIVLFQDIDFENFTDVHDLCTFCLQADLFLLVLTEGVFDSYYVVVSKLMTRMKQDNTRIVLLLDTDARHGGGMIEDFIEMVMQSEIVQKHCRSNIGMTPAEFCRTLFRYPVVVWHRKRAFRLLSLLKLLEEVKQQPLEWEGVRPLPPLTIRRVENGFTAHLGISAHHQKSKMLMRSLEATHPDIVTVMVEDAADFAQCEKVVVVLADMCFESPEYAQHVESAIQYRTETNLVLHTVISHTPTL